jgi:hypothetical protein
MTESKKKKKYEVKITEVLVRRVEVEADDEYEAEDLIADRWRDSVYILDADDFSEVSFEAHEMPPKDNIREETR